jgi:rare lipoprotein A
MKINKYISGILIGIGFVSSVHFAFAQEEVLPLEETTTIYTDINIGHPEYVAIKYMTENGIISGYPDGSFKPDNLINRAEALKIILEANKIIDPIYIKDNTLGGISFDGGELPFPDIYKSLWYYPYVKKGLEEGIISGYPDGTFKPSQTVNRAESFKMAMESDKIILPEVTENLFSDVYKDQWFAKYFLEAKFREIVYINMQNGVNPGKEMTRSNFTELVYRYIKSKEGHKFGKASYYSDSLEGHGTASGVPYRAAELTAAHLTLPFGTVVRVTNLANGKSVDVRINDRGPYVTGRSIDLSKTAFGTIASLGSGIIYIEYEIITQQ